MPYLAKKTSFNQRIEVMPLYESTCLTLNVALRSLKLALSWSFSIQRGIQSC